MIKSFIGSKYISFFYENARALHFIVLEREREKKEGPHTNPFSHMETRYESQGPN